VITKFYFTLSGDSKKRGKNYAEEEAESRGADAKTLGRILDETA
jgi:hypothetical protein